MVAGAATNFEGIFTIWAPCKDFGEYEIELCAIGFKTTKIPINIDKKNKDNVELGDIYLEDKSESEPNVIIGIISRDPLIDKDPYGAKGHVEYDGVKVIVR